VKHAWTIHLALAAEQDYREILRWTVANFGQRQARTYAKTLTNALRELAHGPAIIGVGRREDIGPGIHTLHVARKGRKGRHFVVFRVDSSCSENVIDVLRLLHDSMDLPHHLTAANEPDSPA
jgi:toxin ParE1/3/4